MTKTYIAGEEIKQGQWVRVGDDGKVYRADGDGAEATLHPWSDPLTAPLAYDGHISPIAIINLKTCPCYNCARFRLEQRLGS